MVHQGGEARGVEGFASPGMDGQGETHKRGVGFCLFVVNRLYLVPGEFAEVKGAFCNLFGACRPH